jgi:hypothetical protein
VAIDGVGRELRGQQDITEILHQEKAPIEIAGILCRHHTACAVQHLLHLKEMQVLFSEAGEVTATQEC